MAADLIKFKDHLQEHVSIAAPQIHTLWVETLLAGADLDDYRKYMEFAAKVTGANVDPKADANAGLAVFHFHMDGSGMTAQVQSAPAALELVEEVQAAKEILQAEKPELNQTADPISKVSEPELPVIDVMSELDALLGGLDEIE